MWTTRLQNELVSVIFSPQHLSCAWIKQSNKRSLFSLHAYQQIDLHSAELEQGILFNPTQIGKHISDFLSQYSLSNAFISFACSGPAIKEKFIVLQNPHPTRAHFNFPDNSHILWNWKYVYPRDNGLSTFYVCGFPQTVLLQYKLLAIKHSLNVITVTTPRMALLQLYKAIHGTAYRNTQLALDMQQHHNVIELLFSHDLIRRVIELPEQYNSEKYAAILPACGLFVTQELI